jgi:hypothetical protein
MALFRESFRFGVQIDARRHALRQYVEDADRALSL